MTHDFEIKNPRATWRIAAMFALAMALVALSAPLSGLNKAAIQLTTFVSMLGIMFAMERWAAARTLRAIRLSRETTPSEDFGCYAEAMLSHYPRFETLAFATMNRKSSPLKDLAVEALRRLGASAVVRLTAVAESLPAAPEPLNVEFEPIPFSERDAGFAALADQPATLPYRERLRLAMDVLGSIFGKSRAMRNVVIVMMVLGMITLAVQVVDALRTVFTGRIPVVIVPITSAVVFVAALLVLNTLRPQAWFLVPGALLVREASWRARGWKLHLFRADDAALVYWRDLNMLAVAGANGKAFSRATTPREMQLLLRVWQSSITPPPLERLSDLR